MAAQRQEQLASLDVPQADRAVDAAGREAGPIRGERRVVDRALVTDEGKHNCAFAGLPLYTQGGSLDIVEGLVYANAIDLVLGL